jgi:magnesium transporter
MLQTMAMQTAMRHPVPSRNLILFLRSQPEIAALALGNGRQGATSSCICGKRRPYTTNKQNCAAVPPAGRFIAAAPLRANSFTSRKTTIDALRAFGTSTSSRKWIRPDGADPGHATSWQERLWGVTARGGGTPLRPDDLPARGHGRRHGPEEYEENEPLFNSRRVTTSKTTAEPRLRCTEVDEHGEVILVDGEFKKSELIAKYGLLPRDLRKIDSSNLPHILVRPSAILLNLLHLKVLIKKDRVLLFDIYGSKTSYPQSAFMYDLQGKLQQRNSPGSPGLPYEFRALEAVLTSVTSEMEADFEAVREPVINILSELEDDIDRHKLRVLLILSKRVSTFEQKAKLVRDAIEELLEADDDLAEMYLTEKTHDLYRGTDDHTEVEMLLESYHKITDEIVQEAGNLVSGIRNTEEM